MATLLVFRGNRLSFLLTFRPPALSVDSFVAQDHPHAMDPQSFCSMGELTAQAAWVVSRWHKHLRKDSRSVVA